MDDCLIKPVEPALLLATIIVGLPAYLLGLLFLRVAEPTMLSTYAAVERIDAVPR